MLGGADDRYGHGYGRGTYGLAARLGAALSVLLAAVLAGAVPPAAAGARASATVVVDDDGSASATDCDATGTAAAVTIAGGVAAASPGDTVLVCPGSYPQPVQVDRALAVRSVRPGQAVLPADFPGFTVTAGPTSLSGFAFSGPSGSPAVTATGAALQFLDNAVQGRSAGLRAQGGAATTVTGNTFSGTAGVAVDVSGGAVTVTGNVSTGDQGLLRAAGAGPVSVLDNTVARARDSAVELTGARTALVQGNRLQAAGTAGLVVAGQSRSVRVSSNSISTGAAGIVVRGDGVATPLLVRANRLVGNPAGGIVAAPGGLPVSAQDNWWGCNAGPGASGCDGRAGPVNAPAWLVLRLTAAPGNVPAGTAVHVTADLSSDSQGRAPADGRTLPADVPVALISGAGSWGDRPVRLTGGFATAVLQLGRTGTVQARVDGQDVSVPVRVTPAPAGPFLTLLFSRTQIAVGAGCAVAPGAVPLDTGIAPELAQRGLAATATLSPGLIQESTRVCGGRYSSGSWRDAAQLRDRYGWTFVSHGQTYADMTSLTPQQQRAQSCGSLPAFTAHGHLRANGLFAYPGNAFTTTIQRNIVSSCFSYGRTYGGTVNTRASLVAPFLQHTQSIDGGRCNLTGQPCAKTSTSTRYDDPTKVAAVVRGLGAQQWYTLQAYRMLSGKGSDWDCTSPDWRAHYTAKTEEYCWGDYLTVLDAITPATRVTDPRTVAVAFGRADHP